MQAGAGSLAVAGKADDHDVIGPADTKMDIVETPPPPPAGNDNILFAAVANLDARLTVLHVVFPLRTAPLHFSRHSDPRGRAQCPHSPHAGRSTKPARISGTGIRARPTRLLTQPWAVS